MKTKKSLAFMISAGIGAVALIMAGLLLFGALSRLKSTEKRLRKHTRELQAYYSKDPFPSPVNVQRERANIEELGQRFEELMELARDGQIRLDQRPSPSTFMGLLGSRRSQLIEYSARRGVELPSGFNFGFDRYFDESGSLPSPDHVPRLMQQLIIVQNLWQVLCEEGVSSVGRIQRDEFEGGMVGRAGAAQAAKVKDAGLMGENDLFAKFHFVLEFRAREQAMFSVLNRLASHKLFIVVNKVDVRKSGPDVKAPVIAAIEEGPGGIVAAARKPDIPPVADRTISGLPVEEPMRVTIELDVYRFREKEGES